jgi:hypothetical protein
LRHGVPQKAVELLEASKPYQLGRVASFMPLYLRGEAYLKIKKGVEAATEFQKILDHRGVDVTSEFHALAHLGTARAFKLIGNRSQSLQAYEVFLKIWKDPDDIPALKKAKAEYAELNSNSAKIIGIQRLLIKVSCGNFLRRFSTSR